MRLSRFALVWVLLLLIGQASPCAAAAADDYREARQQYDLLLKSHKKQLYRHNWERIIDRFDSFVERYPGHGKAPAAVYLAGKASQRLYEISSKQADMVAAVDYYKRLTASYPTSNLADDGLVLAAAALERHLNQPKAAYALYRSAAERYPQGDMAPLARKGVQRLIAYAPRSDNPAAKSVAVPDQLALTGIRHWTSPDYTRVVLELNGAVQYSTGSLSGDLGKGVLPRIYIDLKATAVGSGIADRTTVSDGVLRQVRVGRQPDQTTRIVLDLATASEFKAFPLTDPNRLVIDIGAVKQAALTAKPDEIRALPVDKGDAIAKVLAQTPEERQPQVRLPEGGSDRLRRIVVDAGHGGKDPGAIGPRGTKEKDVTLALAKTLAKRLKTELGCQVILTRDKDVFLALEERTAIANRVGADLFISLHANASRNSSARGVETYYLNLSKNNKAAAVAARENGTSLKQVSDLEMILFDLMANSKINESSRLAAEIQQSMVSGLSRHYSQVNDHGVRQGPFYVLLGATMPSVLVETAFISNKLEEKRLANSRFQQRAADAIVAGVKKYAKASRMIATK